jgi:hypothetical protein
MSEMIRPTTQTPVASVLKTDASSNSLRLEQQLAQSLVQVHTLQRTRLPETRSPLEAHLVLLLAAQSRARPSDFQLQPVA